MKMFSRKKFGIPLTIFPQRTQMQMGGGARMWMEAFP
jgi:hypothetical protein